MKAKGPCYELIVNQRRHNEKSPHKPILSCTRCYVTDPNTTQHCYEPMTKEVQDFHLQLHRTGWSNHHPVRMHWIWLIWGDSAELKSSRMAGEPGAALPPATLSSTNSAKISQPARIPSQLALFSASERAACEQVQIGTRPWSVILELFRVAFQKKNVQSAHVHISMKSEISAC